MQARAHKMANRLAPKTLIPPKSEINPPKRTTKNGDNQETFLQKPSPINQLTKQKHRQICGGKEKRIVGLPLRQTSEPSTTANSNSS